MAEASGYLFGGRFVAGLGIGSLTHVVPMYIAEVSQEDCFRPRKLLMCPALAVTGSRLARCPATAIHHPRHPAQLCVLLLCLLCIPADLADWIAYGTSHIGGTRCAPGVPYTGPPSNGRATFDPYTDVPRGGCTGQSQASWRIPVGIQMFFGLLLGIGMFWMPHSPRWLTEQGREDEAHTTLAWLRSRAKEDDEVVNEFLEIRAEVLIERELRARRTQGMGGVGRFAQPYRELVSSRANAHRLFIGCVVMFYQQFIGCSTSGFHRLC